MSENKDSADYRALKTILISQCFLEHNDELKGHPHYKGQIAGALRHLAAVINVEYKDTIERLYQVDDETAMIISKNYDLLFDNLPKLSFQELNEIAELVAQKAQK